MPEDGPQTAAYGEPLAGEETPHGSIVGAQPGKCFRTTPQCRVVPSASAHRSHITLGPRDARPARLVSGLAKAAAGSEVEAVGQPLHTEGYQQRLARIVASSGELPGARQLLGHGLQHVAFVLPRIRADGG